MRHRQLAIIIVILFSLFVEPAFAATSKIKGKLADGSYRVIGLGADGQGRTIASSSSGGFSLDGTSGAGTTLSLQSTDGSYFGPVLVAIQTKSGKIMTVKAARAQKACGKSGAKAITGLKFPSKNSKSKGAAVLSVGTVKIDVDHRFGYLSGIVQKEALFVSARSAVDSNCTPAGAGGKLGLSKASGAKSLRLASASTDDADGDGVKNSLDADDDNDGVMDSFDVDADGDGIQDYNEEEAGDKKGEEEFPSYIFTNFQLDFEKAYNMHSMPVSQELIDTRMQKYTGIAMGLAGKGEFPVELDGQGLSYLTTGGTGRISTQQNWEGIPFPDSFDSDGNGMGSVNEAISATGRFDFQLATHATSSQIKAGDIITQVFKKNGKEYRLPLMLEFVFQTTPIITSIKLGENAPETTTISYPIADSAPGTMNNCLAYNATTQGSKLTFTVERPQRKGIVEAGEAEYMDMGNLRYVVSVSNNGSVRFCPASSFSSTDPNLTKYVDPTGMGYDEEGFVDTKGDTPFTGSSNALTFTVDLQDCTGTSTGERTSITIKARTPRNDNSGQMVCITRQ